MEIKHKNFDSLANKDKYLLERDLKKSFYQPLFTIPFIFLILFLFIYLTDVVGRYNLSAWYVLFYFIAMVGLLVYGSKKLSPQFSHRELLALSLLKISEDLEDNSTEKLSKDINILNQIINKFKEENLDQDYLYYPHRLMEKEFELGLKKLVGIIYTAHNNQKLELINRESIKELAYFIYDKDERMFKKIKEFKEGNDTKCIPNLFDKFKKKIKFESPITRGIIYILLNGLTCWVGYIIFTTQIIQKTYLPIIVAFIGGFFAISSVIISNLMKK